jgi:tetratricopeptide (TPR) repeat protein
MSGELKRSKRIWVIGLAMAVCPTATPVRTQAQEETQALEQGQTGAQAEPQTRKQSRTFDELARMGEEALREGRYAEAKADFELAGKLPGANEVEVDAGIAMADLQMGEYEMAREYEEKVLSAVSEPHEKAEAHDTIGTAWLREAAPAGPGGGTAWNLDDLRAAEREFRQAVEMDPVFDFAFFNLGTALSAEGREAESESAFKKSIEAASKNPASAANLPFARQGSAPEITARDSNGHEVSMALLRGRYVLLDYWATWCGPCIHALPIIRQLATYLPSGEFILISVNEDSDENTWRGFTGEQKMEWEQVWDKNNEIYFDFGFAPRPQLVIPRYVLIDPQGFILHVYTGTDRAGLMAGEIVRTVNAANGQEPASRQK